MNLTREKPFSQMKGSTTAGEQSVSDTFGSNVSSELSSYWKIIIGGECLFVEEPISGRVAILVSLGFFLFSCESRVLLVYQYQQPGEQLEQAI